MTPAPAPPTEAATADPPTFREVAAQLGWNEAADRVNRWSVAGYQGYWTDAEYDLPGPADAEQGS